MFVSIVEVAVKATDLMAIAVGRSKGQSEWSWHCQKSVRKFVFLLIEAIIWLGGFFLYSIGVDLSSPYRMFITLVVSYSFILTAKLEIPYSFLDSAYTRGFFLY